MKIGWLLMMRFCVPNAKINKSEVTAINKYLGMLGNF